MNFPVRLRRDVPEGHLVAVALPEAGASAITDEDLAPLDPRERDHAAGLPPARRLTWTGGRIALRAALADLAITCGPILSTDRGAPAMPANLSASVSHKT